MRDNDTFRIIKPATALQIIAAIGFLVSLYIIVGNLDYADALTAEAQAKLDRAAAIEAAGHSILPLTHPLNWDAVVIQSGPGIDKAKPRLYIKATNREELK